MYRPVLHKVGTTFAKKGVSLLTTAFILLFVFSSCKDENEDANLELNQTIFYSSSYSVDHRNFDNPYDIYGELHNMAMDYIIGNISTLNDTISLRV
jgi:hypothetical protein